MEKRTTDSRNKKQMFNTHSPKQSDKFVEDYFALNSTDSLISIISDFENHGNIVSIYNIIKELVSYQL
jgi:hypothetical protein